VNRKYPSNANLIFRVDNIQPILLIKEMSASRAFYRDILGFTEAEWGTNNFSFFFRDKSGIYLCSEGQGNPGTWVWIGIEGDIEVLYNSLKGKGVKIRQPPVRYSYAVEMHIEDPDGNVLRLGADPNVKI